MEITPDFAHRVFTRPEPGYDGNGNVGQLVSAADGSVTAHYEYDPYGNITFSNGALASSNPFRFSTKYYDHETGLSCYPYRYYSAGLGRWMNRDPLGEKGGTNLYAFVRNSPTNDVDLFGLTSRSDIPHRLEYSCDCGWVDWGHAGPGPAFEELWDGPHGILSNKGYLSSGNGTGFMVKYGQSMSLVRGSNKYLTHGVKGAYFVRYGLIQAEQEAVALAIFQDITLAFETLQTGLPYTLASSSGYSEEDLPSNLIMFYSVVKGYDVDKIRQICHTVGKDASLAVWDATGGLGHNKSWSPVDRNDKTACCPGAMKWPAELDSIKPASIQSGLWDYWGSGKIRTIP